MTGKLYVVGIGPGAADHLTPAAREAILGSAAVVGYQTYLELIPELLVGKQVVSSGMMKEVERCRAALRLAAAGQVVALVSSGDAGIYGMAGLALELQPQQAPDVAVIIVPGVSAVQAAAARLGAPLMHDFAVISLSDLLTPWSLIRRRLEAAAAADFVVALYNPKSRGRTTQLGAAAQILLRHRPGVTPVGIVRNACREEESVVVTDLAGLAAAEVDMLSLVIVGNSQTVVDAAGRMVTPRGYGKKLAAPVGGEDAEPGKVRALFIGGTGSDVGKSVIAAGLCRLLRQRGYRVAPFKAQNMALNSAVTAEGGEIGRAQALQAIACGLPAHTDMNPVLLKPNSETGSQVIVQGRPVGNMTVREYHRYKEHAWQAVAESYRRLASSHEVVVLEGAGSIAEVNLRDHDIVNLRAAALADAAVVLVADIERGGVFASILGTLELLRPEERARVAGVIINRFRGDAELLRSGIELVEDRTGVPVLGVVPWCALQLPEEDSLGLSRKGRPAPAAELRIGVVRLPRISNFSDFDPLEREPGVALHYLERPEEVAGLDLLILPGTKSTIPDLQFLQRSGLARAIHDYHAAGGRIVGICGGFQMLGKHLADPEGVESETRAAEGLGLLDVETVLLGLKQTHQVEAVVAAAGGLGDLPAGSLLQGYEIHVGATSRGALAQPLLQIVRRSGRAISLEEGAISADGRVWGSYLHGLFDNPELRAALLAGLRQRRGLAPAPPTPDHDLERELDRLAAHLETHLQLEPLFGRLPAAGGGA
ncbi:cobalt-precorrin-3 C17-methyltransferase and adenosylcobyric acid synthase [Desulfuromonas sp. DDH964]|uniref:cobyric acid synthase n=1 Tax=Desulfuromonas sp. DDH964 TaxID=1823759 RepID=UPI00078C340E|nr:cobyric acid synthase [Desulfuromonas sp. DDH964]AMV73393.1 cobalt-precorrin-3 C17-methyltransferase and adenosylcobyric acid synthase [Desulfuromonas sp. DDH964]